MDPTTAWIEEQIGEHHPDHEVGFVGLQRLVSAAVALKRGSGTVFGMPPPEGGFPSAGRLYRSCCEALEIWLAQSGDDETVRSLVRSVLLHRLDVKLSPEQEARYGAPPGTEVDLDDAVHRKDAVGDIARVVTALIASGIDARGTIVEELASASEVAKAWEGLTLPDGLASFLAAWPRKVELEWGHTRSGVSGLFIYDVGDAGELQEACQEHIASGNNPGYFRVWQDSVPFLEVGEGSGYLALGRAGQVVYLDAEGNTDLNGTVLAATLKSFWSGWQSVYFVDFRPEVVELVKAGGLSGGRLAGWVDRAIEPDTIA